MEECLICSPSEVGSDSRIPLSYYDEEDELTESGHRPLSIHIVSVPFLQYSASKEKIKKRMMEYKHVLQQNLAHPFVKHVHVLTTNYTKTLEITKDLPNKDKLTVSQRSTLKLLGFPLCLGLWVRASSTASTFTSLTLL